MQKILHYEVKELLGDGGMGSVYRGYDTILHRDVAIKVLHANLVHDASLLERFRHEATIQAGFSHPNIVSIYDFVEQGETVAIIMEYIKGLTFDRLLKQSRSPLPVETVIGYFIPLLKALDYAHSKGIVHRDIKPGNLILQEVHGDYTPKILDFGIAKEIGIGGRTRTGARMGTILYMAPEQHQDSSRVTHQADIYSMAVTLYEMLSGSLPYEGINEDSTDFAVMEATITKQAIDIRSLRPGISNTVVKALEIALEKDPRRRFNSAMEFADGISGQSRPPDHYSTPFSQPSVQPDYPVHHDNNRSLIMWVFGIAGVIAVLLIIVVAMIKSNNEVPTPTEGPGDTPPPSIPYQNSVSQPTPPPSPSPTDTPPPDSSSPTQTIESIKSDIRDLITNYYDAATRGDYDAMVANCTERIDLMNAGSVDHAYIKKDMRNYRKRWPKLIFEMVGDPDIRATEDPGIFGAENDMHFEVSNNEKSINGTARDTWVIKKESGRWKISGYKQKIIHRNRSDQ